MGVRLVLPFSSQAVLETLECSGNIPWHQEMDFLFGIIPVKSDSTVQGALVFLVEIMSEFVVSTDAIYQVLCVLISYVFDSKIVHH